NATPTSGILPLEVYFGNGSQGATSYFWDFGDGNTSTAFDPTYIYNDEGIFQVMLIATNGICYDTAFINIETTPTSSFIIPNVFTPNGDGNNDVFTVLATNLKSIEGEIFNRWGQKMFAWDNINGYWDGRTLARSEAPDGTYFYIIKAVGKDGKEFSKQGALSLI
ncbi:MAG: T9SS type B sorting domain-containing protein, partial [Flavobacteriales bacterium]|nr:T9SS type B sorting domain-containing protein [Flavobacteriales bacterium]